MRKCAPSVIPTSYSSGDHDHLGTRQIFVLILFINLLFFTWYLITVVWPGLALMVCPVVHVQAVGSKTNP